MQYPSSTPLVLLRLVGVVLTLKVEDGGLDLLRVLGAQIERTRQVDHGLRGLPQLLVHLGRVRVGVGWWGWG